MSTYLRWILFSASLIASDLALSAVSLKEFLSGAKCSNHIENLLDHWNSRNNFRVEFQTNNRPLVIKTPTQTIGKWIYLRKTPNAQEIDAELVTDQSRLIVHWNLLSCHSSIKSIHLANRSMASESGGSAYARMDDHLLEKWLEPKKPGLIYAFSAKMHFSMEGLPTIINVAKKQNLELHLLCEPNTLHLIPESVKTLLKDRFTVYIHQSHELSFRDFGNHYPSLIVYNKRSEFSGVYPGLKSEGEYLAFVRSFLE